MGDLADHDLGSTLGKEVKVTGADGECLLDVEPGTSVHVDVTHANFAEMRSEPVAIGAGVGLSGSSTTIEGLAPGSWTVSLNGTGGRNAQFAPEEVQIDVVAGEVVEAVFERSGD